MKYRYLVEAFDDVEAESQEEAIEKAKKDLVEKLARDEVPISIWANGEFGPYRR